MKNNKLINYFFLNTLLITTSLMTSMALQNESNIEKNHKKYLSNELSVDISNIRIKKIKSNHNTFELIYNCMGNGFCIYNNKSKRYVETILDAKNPFVSNENYYFGPFEYYKKIDSKHFKHLLSNKIITINEGYQLSEKLNEKINIVKENESSFYNYTLLDNTHGSRPKDYITEQISSSSSKIGDVISDKFLDNNGNLKVEGNKGIIVLWLQSSSRLWYYRW
ncbi:hypothetical protein [Mycoplasma crocodyli]|uniref:Uncharacterized protein n=1 Tax=Mycoplasma crocodyli (strain ATCC 51981 / MP145) TaxID=512564 RepID=D5E656_MYCCM|nr:hypothetical protein [Mycoplasma crocodyli]ADE19536.1 hypothetical protein MCRO_0642 [Mycoplasma crocodyli MP145]